MKWGDAYEIESERRYWASERKEVKLFVNIHDLLGNLICPDRQKHTTRYRGYDDDVYMMYTRR
jgi:hypothetical protein